MPGRLPVGGSPGCKNFSRQRSVAAIHGSPRKLIYSRKLGRQHLVCVYVSWCCGHNTLEDTLLCPHSPTPSGRRNRVCVFGCEGKDFPNPRSSCHRKGGTSWTYLAP